MFKKITSLADMTMAFSQSELRGHY
jgi:hypothetical protein